MQCPICEADVIANARYCQVCGTRFAPERVVFRSRREEFALTPDDEPLEPGEDRLEDSQPPPERQNVTEEENPVRDSVMNIDAPWGGFLRRTFAFVIDLVVVCVICLILFILCFIGYKVGLAAHDRTLSSQNSQGLVMFLTWGWMFLVTSYFVIFHGMEGQTVGKWLLGLRVIGEHGARVSYKRASLRWLSELFLAPLVLGFLWIIWSREKRAWHDYLARTWVVKE
ncbi:MAG: RDD family protein [Candidatus Binatia bacterium]